APRLLRVTVKMPHGHEQGWAPQEIQLFTDSIFRAKDLARGLAVMSVPSVQGNTARIGYISDVAVRKPQVHWTTDLGKPWQEREWQSANGRIVSLNEAEATLPETRPLVFFLTLTDGRGAITSSEHVELR